MKSFLGVALCCLLVASALSQSTGVRRFITPEDLWKLKRVGAPSMHTEGTWVAVEVTTFNIEKDDSTSEVWLLSTDGKTQKQLTRSGGKNSTPKWSPDGKLIAFTSKRTGDERPQIYTMAIDGGEAKRVSELPDVPTSIKWSGDSKTIYCLMQSYPGASSDADHRKGEEAAKQPKSKAVVIDDAQYRYWDKWQTDGKRPVVMAVNIESGKHDYLLKGTKLCVYHNEPSEAYYDVSPDGKTLCYVSDSSKEYGRDINLDLYTRDLTNGQSEPVLITQDNTANDSYPAFSPDGKTIAFTRQKIKYFYADRARLCAYDISGKTTKVLTEEYDRTCTTPQWLADGNRIACEIESDGKMGIGFIDSKTGKVMYPPEKVSERSISFAKTKRMAAYLRSSFDEPPRVYVHGPGGEPLPIESFNENYTSIWTMGKYEVKTFKGADDKDIQMFLVYPPYFDASKKYPLVQMVHGGPHNAFLNDFSFRWNPQVWAAQGWVIAIVNFHGSSGFGQQFTDSITGDLGTKPMLDIMKSTEWLEQQPWIDKSKIAAAGASYGGYMMAWLNGHTDKFKTMVCHAGVYNWHSMMASDIVLGRNRSLGAFPWDDPTIADKQTPQRFAKNFKTPTLVLHGEKDYRVPLTQGMEYYNTLRQKGVPSRFVYFPDENHWILKPQNSLLWHREVFGWLKKYLD